MAASIRELEPIAIVGMGCRFPGGANSPERFWEMIVRGDVVICKVPPDRWDVRRFFDSDKGVAGKTITRGRISDGRIDQFDASFFGISPREAAAPGPATAVALGSDLGGGRGGGAGHGPAQGDTRWRVRGCFWRRQPAPSDEPGAGTWEVPIRSRVAARRCSRIGSPTHLVSRGQSLTIDTACSSSLVALHFASQSLWNGKSDTAIAGGVNMMF